MIGDNLKRAELNDSDERLPDAVKVRHGRNRQGKLLRYYFNYSGQEQSARYSHGNGSDLLTGASIAHGQILRLKPWDLAIISEQ